MSEQLGNFAKTTLDGGTDDTQTSIDVTDASLLPAAPFYMVIETEIVRVTAKASNTLTVTRGQEGTSAAAHADLMKCGAALTAQTLKNAIADYGSLEWLSSTRGKIPVRGASSWSGLTVGSANQVLASDGTDPLWSNLTALLDAVFGSTRGSMLYRGSSGWAAVTPSTNYFCLRSNGAGADPSYSSLPTIFQGPFGTTQGSLIHCGAAGTWQAKSYGTAGYILRANGSGADISWDSPSAVFDSISGTRGVIPYRGSSGWAGLSPGTSGYLMASNGTGADPSYISAAAALEAISSTRGTILYRGASGWVALSPGTSGYIMQTAGAGADPQWSDISNILGNLIGPTQGSLLVRGSGASIGPLAPGASGTILASNGTSSTPSYQTFAALMEGLSTTQGVIPYRGSSAWAGLSPGTSGYLLKSNGAAANPSYVSQAASLDTISSTQGSVLHRDGSTWSALSVGNAGDVLTSGGASANVSWSSPGLPGTFGGRLSLESGVSISTTNQTAKTTLYAVPHAGSSFGCGVITTYESSRWIKRTFANTSLSLSGFTASTPYDIFGYFSSGVFTLDAVAWSSGTARATSLATQDGVYVKSGATDRLYLGTILTTASTGQCEFSYGGAANGGQAAYVGVWNMYNQIPIYCSVEDTTDSWTYSTSAYRAANNSNANRVTYVCGLNMQGVEAFAVESSSSIPSGSDGYVAIGVDSTTTRSGLTGKFLTNSSNSAQAYYKGRPGIGMHYLQWLETRSVGAGTLTFVGDGGGTQIQSGLTATVWG